MNLTPAQCRAARGLVNMTQQQLAEASGVSLRTITHFEKGGRTPIPAILRALKDTLEAAGVIFIPSNGEGVGVRLRKGTEPLAGLNHGGN
ncbi:transcriptional regulator with XRE-family HTH domain [Azospirillum fermentarium]|uniref:helix-turn-helix transcriptional regulator n=1 Tax=Azospirillum fermentarium TaxID=1233114 RepID=UPI002226B952|nr:helix-turn-helix transcriptional regulator [Azospirillum fermentarium]MCW2249302.1 transcriptional regulator with XRE-family HTH domain [Azospirillum fermentarium]